MGWNWWNQPCLPFYEDILGMSWVFLTNKMIFVELFYQTKNDEISQVFGPFFGNWWDVQVAAWYGWGKDSITQKLASLPWSTMTNHDQPWDLGCLPIFFKQTHLRKCCHSVRPSSFIPNSPSIRLRISREKTFDPAKLPLIWKETNVFQCPTQGRVIMLVGC